MRAIAIVCVGLLIAACAGTELPPNVRLVNGVYHIPPEGVRVNERDGLRLRPGQYEFATEVPGYRMGRMSIEITRDTSLVQVPPGPGFALAEFSFTPQADTVAVVGLDAPDAEPRAVLFPWQADLNVGRYRVEAGAAGHLPLAADFEIRAGQPLALALEFTPEPTGAELVVNTSPPGGELFLDGESIGDAPMRLEHVAFGNHRLEAYVYEDAANRVAFEGNFVFEPFSPRSLDFSLNERQRRFEGRWHPRDDAIEFERRRQEQARRAEEDAYDGVRVGEPLEVSLALAELIDKQQSTLEDFTEDLYKLLRAGDRLLVDLNGAEHRVWKRTKGERSDSAFRRQVAALWNNEPRRFDYEEDNATRYDITPTPGSSLISTVAYRLYRRVNEHPILDLRRSMHELDGIEVHALAEDGDVTFLAFGGSGLLVNGSAVEQSRQLGFRIFPANNQSLRISWEDAPQNVLVVSERNTLARPDFRARALDRNEKGLVDFGVAGTVLEFHRFTQESGDSGAVWTHFDRQRSGPLAAQMSLDVDQIGPHAVPGGYRREWVVNFETGAGVMATRQIAWDYQVEDAGQDSAGAFVPRRNQ